MYLSVTHRSGEVYSELRTHVLHASMTNDKSGGKLLVFGITHENRKVGRLHGELVENIVTSWGRAVLPWQDMPDGIEDRKYQTIKLQWMLNLWFTMMMMMMMMHTLFCLSGSFFQCYSSPLRPVPRSKILGILSLLYLLQAGCHYSHPTNHVKALNQPRFNLSTSHMLLVMELKLNVL